MAIRSILSIALTVVVPSLFNTVVNIIKIIGSGTRDHPLAINHHDEEVDSKDGMNGFPWLPNDTRFLWGVTGPESGPGSGMCFRPSLNMVP